MIKIENDETYGWKTAIRGMRNPMNSWSKSDSKFDEWNGWYIGENDLNLMERLVKAGTVVPACAGVILNFVQSGEKTKTKLKNCKKSKII